MDDGGSGNKDRLLLEGVIADVNATGTGLIHVREVTFSSDEDGAYVEVTTDDLSYWARSIDTIIDSLQADVIHDLGGKPWPRCPMHQTHPLEFDTGAWTCPFDRNVRVNAGMIGTQD